jgi:hypothetical protein
VKSHEEIERYFIVGREKTIILLEGSQASPDRSSDKCSMKMKTFGWLQAVA